jgi:hypothetical protein
MLHHLTIVAIDLAKKVFHLVGSDTAGRIRFCRKFSCVDAWK